MDFEYHSCGASKKGRHQDNLFSGLDMLSTFLYSMIVATFLVLLPLESFLSGFLLCTRAFLELLVPPSIP